MGEFILGHLYRCMHTMIKNGKVKAHRCSSGPMWMIQAWLFMYFPDIVTLPERSSDICFGYTIFQGVATLPHLKDVIAYFLDTRESPNTWCPILSWRFPPKWLTYGWEITDDDDIDEDTYSQWWGNWCNALTSRNLMIGNNFKHSGSEAYCPNYLSRQFGYTQAIPCPFLIDRNEQGLTRSALPTPRYVGYLGQLHEAYLPSPDELPIPDGNPSSTNEFEEWWEIVIGINFGLSADEILKLNIFQLPETKRKRTHADVFLLQVPQQKKRKGNYEHHLEIVKFERFYKFKYDPTNRPLLSLKMENHRREAWRKYVLKWRKVWEKKYPHRPYPIFQKHIRPSFLYKAPLVPNSEIMLANKWPKSRPNKVTFTGYFVPGDCKDIAALVKELKVPAEVEAEIEGAIPSEDEEDEQPLKRKRTGKSPAVLQTGRKPKPQPKKAKSVVVPLIIIPEAIPLKPQGKEPSKKSSSTRISIKMSGGSVDRPTAVESPASVTAAATVLVPGPSSLKPNISRTEALKVHPL
ncbi:uncharacterized protein LOC126656838 [Mercurialis annua]|uniref:uncharacterized protein LOC126656838 n=1 Tax=Mercurialis annua TaxID=3986 RepID=UPI0024AE2624|nr:uncharacterized protein LOC126656838 [Mercurialis annua]